jgi:hypothetical protein
MATRPICARHVALLDNTCGVAIIDNMAAELLIRERIVLASDAIVEMIAWRVPQPVPGSAHGFKYRFAYVVDDICVLRYDNEAGKGDHRHLRGREEKVSFKSIDALIGEFIRLVEKQEAAR